MAPKAALRFSQSFFPLTLLVILLLSSAGCPDWVAYNIKWKPPELRVIPQEKLYTRWNKVRSQHPQEEENKLARSARYDETLEDYDWGVAFQAVAAELHGWQPDFCSMYKSRNRLHRHAPKATFESELGFKSEELFKEAFWKSYLINVYYDAVLQSPSLQNSKDPKDSELKDSIKELLQAEDKYLDTLAVYGPEIWGRSPSEVPIIGGIQNTIVEKVSAIQNKPPSCPDNDEPSTSEQVVPRSFAGRLLLMIDDDHDQLLVDFDQERNSETGKIQKQIAAWWDQRKHQDCCRALTVSKVNPALLSQSIQIVQTPPNEKQPFFLKATDRGQQAVMSAAGKLLKRECSPNGKNCKDGDLQNFKQMLDMLEEKKPNEAVLPFEDVQKVELTSSAVLNSPDPMNRLEYVTSYIYFNQYPYPSNGAVVLEEEFWQRVRGYLAVKPQAERRRALNPILDAVWADMRVRIDNVETTVVQTTQEIAQVSREATQGAQIKPEPSIEWMGTAKGKIETPIDVSSHVKTTVTEKLLKELDRRSTWLNPDRNLLRITERGMEAANIQGSFKEIISLRIPKSVSSINYIDYRDKTVKIGTVGQPLYSSIPAVAVSLGVVREPYKLKRSVSEKYGLADSSHARYIVAVAEPVGLRLWNWTRVLKNLDMDVIDLQSQPPLSKPTSTRLRFYHQESGAEGVLYVGSEGTQDFITELRKGLHDLTQPKSESPTPQPPFPVQCKWADAQNKKFYLVLSLTPKTPTTIGNIPTEKILIGKEEENEERGTHMIPFNFDGDEEKGSAFFRQIKSNNRCTS